MCQNFGKWRVAVVIVLTMCALLPCRSGLTGQQTTKEVRSGVKRPNFIVIFTDDQGYNDLGCFGSPNIKTPNIDRMAAEGMRFTDFYSGASVCTPSRAALLTGCYPERVGNLPVLFPHSDRGLSHDETTIPEMLKSNGYATACIGKWHLGHHSHFLPTEHGFDEYFGIPYSNDMGIDTTMTLSPNVEFREGQNEASFREESEKKPPIIRGKEIIQWPADQTQLTQRYTHEALRFIEKNKDKPFFIYLPHTMPHIPLYASNDFRGASDAGLYGDTLQEIDWSVGEILSKLDELGLDENTLIVYTSDNGPWDLKGNETDKVKGNMNRRIGGSADPLRGFKFSKWEGGMRVPCVMRWRGHIPAGQTCQEIAGSIDLLPTFAALSSSKLPPKKIDGLNIADLALGKEGAKTPHSEYFYRTSGVRSGKWKYIDGKLFDLETDISEKHDLTSAHPKKAAELKQRLEEHRNEMRTLGRKPSYHQRDPFSLKNDDRWEVQRGRWNYSKKNGLRQQADWLDALLKSESLPETITNLSALVKLVGGAQKATVTLADGKQQQVSLSIDANGLVVLSNQRQETLIRASGFRVAGWHIVQIDIAEGTAIASVDGIELLKLSLPAMFDPKTVELESNYSKVDFRNVKATSQAGNAPIVSFPHE